MTAFDLARGWIGTDYVHQASSKGAGTDCLGLIRGIWRELYGEEPCQVPAYSRDWAEPGRDEVLWRAAARHLVHRDGAKPEVGDVLLFRMRDGAVAKHLGIYGLEHGCPSFIHAYEGHGVILSPFSEPWQRRVVAAFSFP